MKERFNPAISYSVVRHENQPEKWWPLQNAKKVIEENLLWKEAFEFGFRGRTWAEQNITKGERENLHRGSNITLCVRDELVLINPKKINHNNLLIHSFDRTERTDLESRIRKILNKEILGQEINDYQKVLKDSGIWNEAFCGEKGVVGRPSGIRGEENKELAENNPYEGSNIFILMGNEVVVTNIKDDKLQFCSFVRVESNGLKERVVELLIKNQVIR